MLLVHERRFLASLIDIGIVLIISLVLNILIFNTIFINNVVFYILYFIVSFIYMFVSLAITKDATVGLYIVSIKYMGKDWSKPAIKSIILRSLIHGVPIFYIVNILYMLMHKTDESLFDKISDTFVVKIGETYKVEDSEKI